MQGKNGQQQTAFIFNFHQRLFDTVRYQLKINFHNFGKHLENMIVKQKQEHSMIRRQHFVVIFLIHVVLSTVP